MIYVITILICVLFCLISKKYSKAEKLIVMPFLITFFISAIRYNVGMDYNSYYELYNNINSSLASGYEKGFCFIIKILRLLFNTPQALFVLTSFIFCFLVYKCIKANEDDKALQYFIFITSTFYFFSMNGIRQSIAIIIFYYSLKYVKEKNFNKYLICNLLGIIFHEISIVFIPLYFVLGHHFKNKNKLIIIIVVALLSNYAVKLIGLVLSNTKYYHYIRSGSYFTLGKFNISSIINLLIFIMYCIGIKDKNEDDIIYENIHFLGIITSIFLPILPLANRFFINFRYIEFLSVPNLVKNINLKEKKYLTISVYALYTIYFLYSLFIGNSNSVLPYKTFF